MEIILNEHNKVEYPPMHTVEHILNQTMVRMFGCERSKNSHIEKRKSKCDYKISIAPTSEQVNIGKNTNGKVCIPEPTPEEVQALAEELKKFTKVEVKKNAKIWFK